MQRLRASPTVVALLDRMAGLEAHGILGGNDHLGAATGLLHPLADPPLAFTGLVAVGSIYEVASQVVEGVEKRERHLLGAFAHAVGPSIPNAFQGK